MKDFDPTQPVELGAQDDSTLANLIAAYLTMGLLVLIACAPPLVIAVWRWAL